MNSSSGTQWACVCATIAALALAGGTPAAAQCESLAPVDNTSLTGVITAIGKIRNHFGVNRLAQAAAVAALGDPAFTAGVVAEVAAGRFELGHRLARQAEALVSGEQDEGLSDSSVNALDSCSGGNATCPRISTGAVR